MSRSDREVARVAGRQYGVLARADLLAIGLSNGTIQRWVRSGRLAQQHRGVYLLGGVERTWQSRLLAACLSTRGAASHRSSELVWGCRCARPCRPEVVVEGHRRIHLPGVVVHRSTNLPADEIVVRQSIPVTIPTRMLVDIGAVSTMEHLEAVTNDVLDRGLATWPAILTTFLRHARRGRDGCGSLRSLLDERYGARPAGSTLELAVERLLRDAGLPNPERQWVVSDDVGFIMRLDFGYPAYRVAIEVDSKRYHLTDPAFEQDRRKRNRLRLAGWLLIEVTELMLREDPVLVVRQVLEALVSRGWQPPPQLVLPPA